jgi:hypothetical protein
MIKVLSLGRTAVFASPKVFNGAKFTTISKPPQKLFSIDKSQNFKLNSILSVLTVPAFARYQFTLKICVILASMIDLAYFTDYNPTTKLALSGVSALLGVAFFSGIKFQSENHISNY